MGVAFRHSRALSWPISSPCKNVVCILAYIGCETCSIYGTCQVGSIQLLYPVQVVLLRPSVPSSGAALLHKDNGVGFSVSATTVLKIPDIFEQCARPQSPHLAYRVCIGDFPLGSAHSSGKFQRKVSANGLDVRSNAAVPPNTIPLTTILLTEATFLLSRVLSHTQLA